MKGDGQILDKKDQEYRGLRNSRPDKLKFELKELEKGWADYERKRKEGTMSMWTLRELNCELKDGKHRDTMINREDEMLKIFLEKTNSKINRGPEYAVDDYVEDQLRKR